MLGREPVPGAPGPEAGAPPAPRRPGVPHWTRVFWLGLLLWVLAVALLVGTQAVTLVPTVILLGSFLVPVTAVVFYFERTPGPALSAFTVASAFLLGGLLGVYGAVLLEALFVQPGVLQYLGVGLIEELAKLVALAIVARHLSRYTTRDGIVLGAAVGFGFAALESSGYAFAAALSGDGLSVSDLVQTEVLRGLLAPVGHGLWTAIVGGALFHAASAKGHLRLTGGVVLAYLLASLLHGLWDSMGDLAVYLAFELTASPAQRLAVATGRGGRVRPTQVQTLFYLALYWGGLLLVSAAGLVWLRRAWRRGAAEEEPPAPPAAPAAPAAGPLAPGGGVSR